MNILTTSAVPRKSATVKIETAAQRKLREAQELVKAAKKAEQDAWRAKWEAQQKDPAYQAKQARLAETREERSRKMAIGKENAQLSRLAKLMEEIGDSMKAELTAYHEAGHAVLHEVLGNGVSVATIIPSESNKDTASEDDSIALGHVSPRLANFPMSDYERNLHRVVCSLAGGIAAEIAGDDDPGTDGDEEIIEKIIETMNLDRKGESNFRKEAQSLCCRLLGEPKMWAAVEEVKEALLTYKTIPGDVVRAIVKKQDRPDLFPVSITKQLSFHYRKEFVTSYWGGRSLFSRHRRQPLGLYLIKSSVRAGIYEESQSQ